METNNFFENGVYNYRESMISDILGVIAEWEIMVTSDTRMEIENRLIDELWNSNRVTGNGSGSYTYNRFEAENYLHSNLELLGEVLEELGCGSAKALKDGPEACDVAIRCYLLAETIIAAIDRIISDNNN